MVTPSAKDCAVSVQTVASPAMASQKVSGAPKASDHRASVGVKKRRTAVPIRPPMVEPMTAMAMASRALPFCARGKPSMAVQMAAGVPGVLSSTAEMEPPNSAAM